MLSELRNGHVIRLKASSSNLRSWGNLTPVQGNTSPLPLYSTSMSAAATLLFTAQTKLLFIFTHTIFKVPRKMLSCAHCLYLQRPVASQSPWHRQPASVLYALPWQRSSQHSSSWRLSCLLQCLQSDRPGVSKQGTWHVCMWCGCTSVSVTLSLWRLRP